MGDQKGKVFMCKLPVRALRSALRCSALLSLFCTLQISVFPLKV
jgi:hypothetical protein